MTRDQSSVLFLRRATRLRREVYEVIGVYKYTYLARLYVGSLGYSIAAERMLTLGVTHRTRSSSSSSVSAPAAVQLEEESCCARAVRTTPSRFL